jgi:RNA polymerase sigma factor (sigma-70 family)
MASTSPPGPVRGAVETESSFGLLTRAKGGDQSALQRLAQRYTPRLRRWVRHKLPLWARDVNDTDDLVQETLINVFRNVHGIEMNTALSLRAYMRNAAQNRVSDEVKRATRRPQKSELSAERPSSSPSPADIAISREEFWRCRVAIARLTPADRQLILLKLSQSGMTFRALAAITGKNSEDAARVALNRAINRLAQEMERLGS